MLVICHIIPNVSNTLFTLLCISSFPQNPFFGESSFILLCRNVSLNAVVCFLSFSSLIPFLGRFVSKNLSKSIVQRKQIVSVFTGSIAFWNALLRSSIAFGLIVGELSMSFASRLFGVTNKHWSHYFRYFFLENVEYGVPNGKFSFSTCLANKGMNRNKLRPFIFVVHSPPRVGLSTLALNLSYYPKRYALVAVHFLYVQLRNAFYMGFTKSSLQSLEAQGFLRGSVINFLG